jgi:hypothetical protein
MKIPTDNIFMCTEGTFLWNLKLKHTPSLFTRKYKCNPSVTNLIGLKTPFYSQTSSIKFIFEVVTHRNDYEEYSLLGCDAM